MHKFQPKKKHLTLPDKHLPKKQNAQIRRKKKVPNTTLQKLW